MATLPSRNSRGRRHLRRGEGRVERVGGVGVRVRYESGLLPALRLFTALPTVERKEKI